jgi:hypothetical protein
VLVLLLLATLHQPSKLGLLLSLTLPRHPRNFVGAKVWQEKAQKVLVRFRLKHAQHQTVRQRRLPPERPMRRLLSMHQTSHQTLSGGRRGCVFEFFFIPYLFFHFLKKNYFRGVLSL